MIDSNTDIKTSAEPSNWYAFYVIARHEKKIETLLLKEGFVTYLPIITVVKEWSQRKKKVEEPLFKSYIFVKLKKSQIYSLLQKPSIVNVIKFANEPAIVSEKTINFVKDLITNKISFKISNLEYPIGKTIEIKTGIFKGQQGIVKQVRGTKKLLISLETINYTLEIDI